MDQVEIQAVVSAHGLVKGQKVTVAETPAVKGALKRGVFKELQRFPAPTETPVDDDGPTPDPSDVFADDEEAELVAEAEKASGKKR